MILEQIYQRNSNPNIFYEKEQELNCGSFALNVTEWYVPYIEEADVDDYESMMYTADERDFRISELFRDGYSREEVMLDILDRDFEFILKTCPWLEPIERDEINIDDRVIAYRLSMMCEDYPDDFDPDRDMDFHFRVLIDGEWWEKNGAGEVHYVTCKTNDEPWVVSEDLIYDGEIRYARFK